MSMRRVLGAVLVVSAFHLGHAPHAASLTFDEFDRLQTHQKENFISTVLHYFYYNYRTDPVTLAKADCMANLEKVVTDNGDTHLYSLVVRDLDRARSDPGRTRIVERVIKEVIERECRTL